MLDCCLCSSYYQWTPFILLGMVLLFLLPRFLWHACPRQGGVNISRLVKGIKDDTHEEKGLEVTSRALKLYLDAQKKLQRSVCYHFPGPKIKRGHVIVYFSIKLLYIVNAIGQFVLLNYFLSFEFHAYGFEAIKKLQRDEDWFESRRFPRVTMCDFMIRRLGSNQHWYSVQCNLPFNMYNEKIFFGIWVWLIVLSVLNLISAITWGISLTVGRRKKTIERYLKISRVTQPIEEEKTKKKENEKPKEGTTGEMNRSESQTLLSTTTQQKNSKKPEDSEDQEKPEDPEDQENPDSPEVIKRDVESLMDHLQLDGYLIFRLITRNTNEIIGGKIIRQLNKQLHQERKAEKAKQLRRN